MPTTISFKAEAAAINDRKATSRRGNHVMHGASSMPHVDYVMPMPSPARTSKMM